MDNEKILGGRINLKEMSFTSPLNLKYVYGNSTYRISGSDLSIDSVPITPGIHNIEAGQVIGYNPGHNFSIRNEIA